jgi:hypothetical protein
LDDPADIRAKALEALSIDAAYTSPRGCTDDQILRRTRLLPDLARYVLAQLDAPRGASVTADGDGPVTHGEALETVDLIGASCGASTTAQRAFLRDYIEQQADLERRARKLCEALARLGESDEWTEGVVSDRRKQLADALGEERE